MLSPAELSALCLSLKVAIACVALALGPSIGLAWLLARREFIGKTLVEGLVQLPLVLPPVVSGYLLLLLLGPSGPIGRHLHAWGVPLAFRWQGAALAAALVGFPLLVRALRLSFEAVDTRLEQASRTLGRGPLQTFARVSLPLALPGLIAGSLLCFARALGEFGATIVFVGNIAGETRTLPLAIYTAIQSPGGDEAAARLALLAVALSFIAVLLGEVLARRGRHRHPVHR